MIKTAVNGPIALMKKYDWADIHYALAHECLVSQESVEFYRDSSKFVILDNGADELGEGMRGTEYLRLVSEIQPDVVILPDVLSNGFETRERGLQFLSEVAVLEHSYGVEYMAVIQGTSEEEWDQEFEFWESRVKYIGIPYDIDFEVTVDGVRDFPSSSKAMNRARRRMRLIQRVSEKYVSSLLPARIHLLGINELFEFSLIEKYGLRDFVFSNDTTAPYAAALSGKSFLMESGGIFSGEKDWDRLDFSIREMTEEQEQLLIRNFVLYKEAVNPVRGHRVSS